MQRWLLLGSSLRKLGFLGCQPQMPQCSRLSNHNGSLGRTRTKSNLSQHLVVWLFSLSNKRKAEDAEEEAVVDGQGTGLRGIPAGGLEGEAWGWTAFSWC